MNKEDVWKFEGKMVEVIAEDGNKHWGYLRIIGGRRRNIVSVGGVSMYASIISEIREFPRGKEEVK